MSLSSSDANQQNSCNAPVQATSLTALDSRTETSEVRASQGIPIHTADFIQDPHLHL